MNDADADKADTLKVIIAETQRLRQNALRDGLTLSLNSASKRCMKLVLSWPRLACRTNPSPP